MIPLWNQLLTCWEMIWKGCERWDECIRAWRWQCWRAINYERVRDREINSWIGRNIQTDWGGTESEREQQSKITVNMFKPTAQLVYIYWWMFTFYISKVLACVSKSVRLKCKATLPWIMSHSGKLIEKLICKDVAMYSRSTTQHTVTTFKSQILCKHNTQTWKDTTTTRKDFTPKVKCWLKANQNSTHL